MKWPDLHISGSLPDWEQVPPVEWNEYQRRASDTYGIDTPGNRLTALGLLLSIAGNELIRREYSLAGTILLEEGRRFDMKDGKRADETGTKGPVGEAFDAWSDNLILIQSAAVLKSRGIISNKETAYLGLLVASKFIITGAGKALDKQIKPNRFSKYGSFVLWAGIGTKLVGHLAGNHVSESTGEILDEVGGALMTAGAVTNAVAVATYTHKLLVAAHEQHAAESQAG